MVIGSIDFFCENKKRSYRVNRGVNMELSSYFGSKIILFIGVISNTN